MSKISETPPGQLQSSNWWFLDLPPSLSFPIREPGKKVAPWGSKRPDVQRDQARLSQSEMLQHLQGSQGETKARESSDSAKGSKNPGEPRDKVGRGGVVPALGYKERAVCTGISRGKDPGVPRKERKRGGRSGALRCAKPPWAGSECDAIARQDSAKGACD